jgi:cytoskeletal protein CcmA (bactofilin family)
MFGSNKEKNLVNLPAANNNGNTGNSHNRLVSGTTIEGQLNSENDIRIDGTLKGTLECNAKVYIGSTGIIEGQVNCKNAVIEGRVDGNVKVSDTLKIEATGHISGDVVTNKLIVASGAVLNGTCKMGVVSDGNEDFFFKQPSSKSLQAQLAGVE